MKKLKRFAQIYFISSLMAMILFVLFSSLCYSGTLVDYENSSLYSPSGGYFNYYHEGDSVLTLDTTQGLEGSSQCLHVNTILTNFHIWYIQNAELRNLIPEAYGCDRMSFLIKTPEDYPLRADTNFHVGTYTRDPEIPSNIQGEHYYHYFNIQGSTYPTKFVLNQHPQHHTGWSGRVPDNHPDEWDYYDGFTRFYLELLPLNDCPISLPFVSYVDEVKFYTVSEPENDETINSISCTYLGDGKFQIGWHGNSLLWDEYLDDEYEVRYSLNPITNDNYSSATIVSGGPFSRFPGSYSFIQAEFAINVQDNTRYYFAIKDLDSDIPYVTKIDYPVGTVQSRSGGNHAPVISDFTVTPSTVFIGDSVTFNVAATDEDGDDLTYTINFGDGTSNGHGSEVVHSYASAGTYTAQATVNDGQGGSATQSVEVVVNQQAGEHFYGYYELEDGTINSPFSIGADENASSGHYVFVQEGTDPSSNPQTNVTMDVTIPYESDYYMWVCMYGPSSSSDALYIGLDGTFDRVYPSAVGEYEYVRVETVHGTGNYTFHLNAGTHVINVGCGEPLARADLILITSDSAFVPSQGSTPPPVNVSPTINNFTATPSSLNNPGETITLNVSATDPNGDSLTYTINFGDGTANGSGSQVEHTYEAKGTYTAEVTVDDGNGHIVGKSLQIAVNDVPPAKPTGVTVN